MPCKPRRVFDSYLWVLTFGIWVIPKYRIVGTLHKYYKFSDVYRCFVNDCRCVFGGRGTYTRHIFSITRHTNNSPLVTYLLVSRNRNPTQIGFIPKRSFGSYDCKGKRKWVWLSVRLDPRASATSPGISFFPFLGFVFLGLFFIYSQACPTWQQDGCW